MNMLSPWPQKRGLFATVRRLPFVFPVLRLRYWFRGHNRWFSNDPALYWFTIRLPALPLPYVSWRGPRVSWYAGFKQYRLHHPQYLVWLPRSWFGRDACHLSIRFSWGASRGWQA